MKRTRTRIWLLLLVALIAAGLITACSTGTSTQSNVETAAPAQSTSKFVTLPPEQVLKIIRENKDNPNFVILDVRTPEEYQSGHIDGAINVDFYAPDFPQQLDKLDKNKVYVLYCRSGNRSGRTVPLMKQLGFREVYEIQGGISNWLRKGLPLNP